MFHGKVSLNDGPTKVFKSFPFWAAEKEDMSTFSVLFCSEPPVNFRRDEQFGEGKG